MIEVSPLFWIVAAMALMAGMVMLTLRWQVIKGRKRREAMQQKALALRLEFVPVGHADLVAEIGRLMPRTHKRWEQVSNLLYGERHGLQFELLDFSFVTGSGKHQHSYRQTVVRCRMSFTFPDFYLRPEHIFDKMGDFVGWHDIDFEHRPEFSGRYFLKGADESAIRPFFTERVLAHLENEPGKFCVDAHGDSLLVYRPYGLIDPEEIEAYLDKCLAIVAAFKAR